MKELTNEIMEVYDKLAQKAKEIEDCKRGIRNIENEMLACNSSNNRLDKLDAQIFKFEEDMRRAKREYARIASTL